MVRQWSPSGRLRPGRQKAKPAASWKQRWRDGWGTASQSSVRSVVGRRNGWGGEKINKWHPNSTQHFHVLPRSHCQSSVRTASGYSWLTQTCDIRESRLTPLTFVFFQKLAKQWRAEGSSGGGSVAALLAFNNTHYLKQNCFLMVGGIWSAHWENMEILHKKMLGGQRGIWTKHLGSALTTGQYLSDSRIIQNLFNTWEQWVSQTWLNTYIFFPFDACCTTLSFFSPQRNSSVSPSRLLNTGTGAVLHIIRQKPQLNKLTEGNKHNVNSNYSKHTCSWKKHCRKGTRKRNSAYFKHKTT